MAKKDELPEIELEVRCDNDGPNATKWTVMYGAKGIQSGVVSGKGSWSKAGATGEKKKREILDHYYKTGEVKRVDKFEAGSFLGVRRKK
ncbi:MAG: hypothetical protein EKK33_02240 [Bradyrhizobiaceae bacterium]|nr:MAG: hypothetical protein EKK33_02240 [Bradyrhizobiaceae bacterium]